MFSAVHTQDSYCFYQGLMFVTVKAVKMEQSQGIFFDLSVQQSQSGKSWSQMMNINNVGDPVMHLAFSAHLLQLAC